MIPELVSFVILLVVFIVAYGIASQALINPAQVAVCLFGYLLHFFAFVSVFGYLLVYLVFAFVWLVDFTGGLLQTGQSSAHLLVVTL